MKALTVAAYVIRRFEQQGSPITNLKLQKVLYYIQMQHLKRYGFPVFEEPMEAWRHGPVVYDVYLRFQRYTSNPIHADDIYVRQTETLSDENSRAICDEIVRKTLELDSWELVRLTCQTDAWKKNFVQGYNHIIPTKEMQDCEMNI